MPAFTSFSDILPDPIFKVSDTGALNLSTGTPGPGFAAIGFKSNKDTDVSRTNSGKGIHKERDSHFWAFTISYNPMLRDEFDVVDAFLCARNGRFNPFFVVLPQYSKPKDATFNTFVTSNTVTNVSAQAAGATNFLIGSGVAITGNPKPGDMFTISDPGNANHLKVYKVVRVETNADYRTGTTQPTTGQRKIHCFPPLARSVTAGSTINFINPKFRVYPTSTVQEHALDKDGLYSFSLDVEEIQA